MLWADSMVGLSAPWRSTMRNAAYRLLLGTGYVAFVRRKWQRQIRILIYHSIAPHQSPFVRGIDATVSPRTFDQQLRYLKRHYRIVSMQELITGLRDRSVSERAIVITFDDGFRDNYEIAWPILRKYDVPATIFLCTDGVDNRRVLWVHRLTYLANRAGEQDLWAIACQYWPVLEGLQSEPTNRFWVMMDFLVNKVLPAERDDFLQAASRSLGVTEPLPQDVGLYLSWDQVREMTAAGIEFGNHTCSHPNLALLSRVGQEREIAEAQETIVEKLGKRGLPFAYPFGLPQHFTSATRRIVRELGHSCALTGLGNLNDLGTSPYFLDRIKVEEEPLPQFAARIEGIWLSQMIRLR